MRSRGPQRANAAVVHQKPDYRSTSEAAFERHSSRLGAPRPQPSENNYLNGLAGYRGRPFRLATLTACRSSRYVSAQPRSVKAEDAENTEVSGLFAAPQTKRRPFGAPRLQFSGIGPPEAVIPPPAAPAGRPFEPPRRPWPLPSRARRESVDRAWSQSRAACSSSRPCRPESGGRR